MLAGKLSHTAHRVATFFYGSFMDVRVLRRVGVDVTSHQPAMLPGFQIELRPRVNVHPSDRYVVHGAVVYVTHEELDRLYALSHADLHARGVTVPADNPAVVYRPEAVNVVLRDGSSRPALCYIADRQVPADPSEEYVESVVAAARALGHPDWYIAHLQSFRPQLKDVTSPPSGDISVSPPSGRD
jgi:hypothetical protein